MEIRRNTNPNPLEDVRRALAFAVKQPRTKYGKRKALEEVHRAHEYLTHIPMTSLSTWRSRPIG